MICERCGDRMQPETIIKLRRRFGRVCATQSRGAYCAGCKASVATEDPVAAAPPGWMRLASALHGRSRSAMLA